jgi:S-adenosylmethionine-diacylglycerol 3-amino-3-carboxypropyl transferase
MAFHYYFGISQEDAVSEFRALDLSDGDSLLCIASAGEIPFNLAAMADVKIVAGDVSANQIRVCRLKQIAAINLDSIQAASFLGYMEMKREMREEIFQDKIKICLTVDDAGFWSDNVELIRHGIANSGKFEIYLQKISGLLNLLIGRKNLYRLFECNSTEEQEAVFERKINGLATKAIFRLAYHPLVYKNIGVDPAGLTHFDVVNIGKIISRRFRNFCCNTPSRCNYFLQHSLFKSIIYPEALPEYLHEDHSKRFRRNVANIEYVVSPIYDILNTAYAGKFNKIHLSNISDWQSSRKFSELLGLVQEKTMPGAKIVLRYIYLNPMLSYLRQGLWSDYEMGNKLENSDRNPFFNIIPITRN